jgi:hypothetical protein
VVAERQQDTLAAAPAVARAEVGVPRGPRAARLGRAAALAAVVESPAAVARRGRVGLPVRWPPING